MCVALESLGASTTFEFNNCFHQLYSRIIVKALFGVSARIYGIYGIYGPSRVRESTFRGLKNLLRYSTLAEQAAVTDNHNEDHTKDEIFFAYAPPDIHCLQAY
jgi:hypothetical protein